MSFERRFEFEVVTRAEAEAIGPPGQRRFRMIFGDATGTVALWLEKQQLQALGLAFEQMIAQLLAAGVPEARVRDLEPGEVGPVPADVHEVEIGRIALGFDEARAALTLFVHDEEAEENDPPNVVVRLMLQQAKIMATQIERVVAAGRPTCPKCGQPIGPDGHVCPHDNGHFPHLVGE